MSQFSFPFQLQHADVCVCLCFIQGRAGYVAQGSNYARDRARAPLFTYVNEDKLKSIETYARKKDFIHAFFSRISSALTIRSLLQACVFSF